jgi:hypothetical protein
VIVLYDILEVVRAVHFERPDPRLGRLIERLMREIRQAETLAEQAPRLEPPGCPKCGRRIGTHESAHAMLTTYVERDYKVCSECGLTDEEKRDA